MSNIDVDRVIVETRVASEGPNTLVAYLLWFFLGYFGAHRFYLGRPGSAIVQLLLCLIVVGIVWWAVDLLLIPAMLQRRRAELRDRLTRAIEEPRVDRGYAAPAGVRGGAVPPRFAYVRAR